MVSINIRDMTAMPEILDRVERGESIIVTRDGRPVARLIPLEAGWNHGRATAKEIVDGFRALRESVRPPAPGDLTIREMIEEGRRR